MRLGKLLGPDLKRALREAPEEVRGLFEEVHVEDLADLMEELDPEEMAVFLAQMPLEHAATVFERLDASDQRALIQRMAPESIAHIASEMESDNRADLFRTLSGDMGDRLFHTLSKVDPGAAEDVRAIEQWSDTSAGHLMTTQYVRVPPGSTIAEAVAAVRDYVKEHESPVYGVHVLDPAGYLLGIAPLASIVTASPEEPLQKVLSPSLISVSPDIDQEEVARNMAKYDLNMIPVLDKQGLLLGVITIDDVVDVLTQEQTEDVQKIGAVEPLDYPYFQTTFVSFLRKRGIWLVVLFVEEFFTQTALRYYDNVFEAIKGAVYYMPLLISAGGNSGSQSSTLVIRGLAVGEISTEDWWRILGREFLIGLMLGTVLGVLGFLRVMMYPDQNFLFALTVGCSLIGIVITGCTIGAVFPILLRRLGVDPATSSTPFIASLVDVVGIIVFVHMAKLIMKDMMVSPIR